ncbi:MAG: hypothetical protein IJX99_00780 [Clostridia bacterium]|nr:hypothetical protein [Clostridia bacterium]
MENKSKYTKVKYRTAICEQGKTIDEIAAERGMTSAAVRKDIRSLYERAAWANKLIGMADANAAAKKELVSAPMKVPAKSFASKKVTPNGGEPEKVSYEVRKAIEEGKAIVDTSYLIDFFDSCKKVEKLIIPRFCLNEMKQITRFESDPKKKAALEVRIKYLEAEAEILFCENLPLYGTSAKNKGFKPRSFNFARYAKYLWEREGKVIPYLTRSYEVNVLLSECQTAFRKANASAAN